MAATLSPRAERRAATRDAILAGTLSLVAQGGWAAASMHDVARRAGVATGSLYRHFPSKGDLLAEVFAEAAAQPPSVTSESVPATIASRLAARRSARVETVAAIS